MLCWIGLQSCQNLLDVFRINEGHRGDLGMTEVHINGKKTIISQHFLDNHIQKKGQNVKLKN